MTNMRSTYGEINVTNYPLQKLERSHCLYTELINFKYKRLMSNVGQDLSSFEIVILRRKLRPGNNKHVIV